MKTSPLLLAVDRNRRNVELLTQFLGKEGYYLVTATTPEEFDRVLMDADDIGLALIDIAGFERSIWERCEGCAPSKSPFSSSPRSRARGSNRRASRTDLAA